jgi:HEAT repeat protein
LEYLKKNKIPKNYTIFPMKKLTFNLLIALSIILVHSSILAQDVRLIKTKVVDILMQMPANNQLQTNKLMDQLIGLGDEGLTEILGMLKAPEDGGDELVRFAVTSLARYTSQKGKEANRDWFQKGTLHAIKSNPNSDIKEYLINQLGYIADDKSVEALAIYLADERLCSPVIQLMLKVGTEKAEKELISALTGNNKNCQASIVAALGQLKSRQALPEIEKLAGSADKLLQKTAIHALANIGDPISYALLWNKALSVRFSNEPTEATVAFLKYIDRLGQGKYMKECSKGCLDFIKANNLVTHLHNRAAALNVYTRYFEKEALPILLKESTSAEASYRMAVLNSACKKGDAGYTAKWINLAKKANPDVKADIIFMLGERTDKSAIPYIRLALKDNSESVRISSVWALVKLDNELASQELLLHLSQGNDLAETEKALLVVIDNKQLHKVEEMLNKSTDAAKPSLLKILAAKSGKEYFNNVFALTSSPDKLIKSSAIAALQKTVSYKDAGLLFKLLPELKNQQDIKNLQTAITNSLEQAENKNEAEALLLSQMANSKQKELFLPIAMRIGGKKSLNMVLELFENADGSLKNASFESLVNWKDASALEQLLAISQSGNAVFHPKAFEGYIRQVKNSSLPDDQKLLQLQKIMPLAKSTGEKKMVLEALAEIKTFLSLVYLGNYLDDKELQQVAVEGAIALALPDPDGEGGFYGDIPRAIIEKSIQLITGPESDYTKENLRKYLKEMPAGKGFVSMFNGKDLSGWKPFIANPIALAKISPKEMPQKIKLATEKMHKNWSVKDGMIVFSGEGDNLLSDKEYGDFEMITNWRITRKGDSGIYLRGSPQVQIWDTSRVEVGAQVGSGGLYNNKTYESKPLKVADNPIGDWNTFRIVMIGERVSVYLNGELVVDNTILENYWDRGIPIFPKGTIELQAHGTDLAFKDIYIREIEPVFAELPKEEKEEGFKLLFNGQNLDGWVGNKTDYRVDKGEIVIQPVKGGSGGNLFTEKEYSDFIFRFEFKLTPGANNGLGIRAPLEGDAAYVGMELQILDNEAPIYANLEPYQYHGSVYGVIPAKRGFLKPTGEWNYQEVIVKGKDIKISLNGTVILDGNIEQASKGGTIDKNDHPGLLRTKGHIGFLGHGSVLWFRNIRLKEL